MMGANLKENISIYGYKILAYGVALSLFTSLAMADSLIGSTYSSFFLYFCLVASLLLLLSSVYFLFADKPISININTLDISCFAYWLWSFIRLLLTENAHFYDDNFLTFTLLGLYYFVIKFVLFNRLHQGFHSSTLKLLIISLLVCGFIQSLYGILQLYGVDPFYNNEYFKLRGTFGNPDPYAGYFSSILPFAFGLFLLTEKTDTENRFIRNASLLTFLSGMFVLPATLIRSSWLSILFGIGFVYSVKASVFYKIRMFLKGRRTAVAGFSLLGIAIIGVLCVLLYSIKPDSANGRLLMWKLSARMVQNNPIIGIGYDRFKVEYNNYQADYFRSGSGTPYEERIAGDVHYAHNEFIQVFVELGLIGIILVTVILGSLVKSFITQINRQERKKYDLKASIVLSSYGSLISIIVFSCFSLPTHILPIFINIAFLVSIISSNSNLKDALAIHLSAIKTTIIGLIFFVNFGMLVFHSYWLNKGYHLWQEAYYNTANGDLADAVVRYQNLYPLFENNGYFLNMYGSVLALRGKHEEAIIEFKKAKCYLNDSELWIGIGHSYDAIGDFENAKESFQHASYIIPSKFYSKYLLAKLNQKYGKQNEATKIAKTIVTMETKIGSTAVNQMKDEMIKLIESNDKNGY